MKDKVRTLISATNASHGIMLVGNNVPNAVHRANSDRCCPAVVRGPDGTIRLREMQRSSCTAPIRQGGALSGAGDSKAPCPRGGMMARRHLRGHATQQPRGVRRQRGAIFIAMPVIARVRPVETSRSLFIKKSDSDLATHGYTEGCPGCNAERVDSAARNHTKACRERFTTLRTAAPNIGRRQRCRIANRALVDDSNKVNRPSHYRLQFEAICV